MIIWGLIIWMVYEATMRVINPVEVNGKIMLIVACIGFVCNLVMMKALHSQPGGCKHGGHSHSHSHGHSHAHGAHTASYVSPILD